MKGEALTSDIIRVLVVDDSAYNRRAITKMLESSERIKVIDTAKDGEEGVKKALELKPDLISLDLQMPKMDGFTFLRILMKKSPIPTIVVSAKSESQNVFRAMELGAVDFLAKPGWTISPELYNIRDDLISKVLSIREVQMRNVRKSVDSFEGDRMRTVRPESIPDAGKKPKQAARKKAKIVAIGSSTGGPTAIQKLLSFLPSSFPAGIVISQHMPPGFTRAFASRLNDHSALEVKEAGVDDEVKKGVALISPGGYHMLFSKLGNRIKVRLQKKVMGEKYVPSIDKMFTSIADVCEEGEVLGIILTGMGDDGKEGVKHCKARGSEILVESKDSAIIYGMPKEAVNTGAVDKEVPLEKIGSEILGRC